MGKLEELADRVERLLLRHEEQQRTNALLARELATVTNDRDQFKARLGAARQRIDTLLARLPSDIAADDSEAPPA